MFYNYKYKYFYKKYFSSKYINPKLKENNDIAKQWLDFAYLVDGYLSLLLEMVCNRSGSVEELEGFAVLIFPLWKTIIQFYEIGGFFP